MNWSRMLPTIVSVIVIILFSVVQNTSKTAGAVLSTMPTKLPLAMWIIWSAAEEAQRSTALSDYTGSALLTIIPTVAFITGAWLASRAGVRLLPSIGIGFAIWGALLPVALLVRRSLGLG